MFVEHNSYICKKKKIMAKYRIHTARKVIETDWDNMYTACWWSGVVESNGHYLPVKYIEVEQADGTYLEVYPRD